MQRNVGTRRLVSRGRTQHKRHDMNDLRAKDWAALKPPLLRFLTACHADFSGETGGDVADYIPELGKADPDQFGISLATLDGHVYEVGDSRIPFTIQSMSKPFVFALALDTLGAARVESAIGVEPSGDPFNSIRLNADNHPFNPMVNAGAITCSGLIRAAKGDDAFEHIRDSPRPLCRTRTRRRRCGLCFRKRNRRPQPRHRLSPAQLQRHQGRRRQGAGGLFPAMRHPGDGARYRHHGRDAGQSRQKSRDRRAGDDALRHLAHALGDDLLRHVRLRRRMDLSGRHSRQERRRRRHPGGAAGAARARQLLAEARQPRQQRARHQGVRGAVGPLRPAHAQPQRRRAQQHHRRLRYRQEPVPAQPPAA